MNTNRNGIIRVLSEMKSRSTEDDQFIAYDLLWDELDSNLAQYLYDLCYDEDGEFDYDVINDLNFEAEL